MTSKGSPFGPSLALKITEAGDKELVPESAIASAARKAEVRTCYEFCSCDDIRPDQTRIFHFLRHYGLPDRHLNTNWTEISQRAQLKEWLNTNRESMDQVLKERKIDDLITYANSEQMTPALLIALGLMNGWRIVVILKNRFLSTHNTDEADCIEADAVFIWTATGLVPCTKRYGDEGGLIFHRTGMLTPKLEPTLGPIGTRRRRARERKLAEAAEGTPVKRVWGDDDCRIIEADDDVQQPKEQLTPEQARTNIVHETVDELSKKIIETLQEHIEPGKISPALLPSPTSSISDGRTLLKIKELQTRITGYELDAKTYQEQIDALLTKNEAYEDALLNVHKACVALAKGVQAVLEKQQSKHSKILEMVPTQLPQSTRSRKRKLKVADPEAPKLKKTQFICCMYDVDGCTQVFQRTADGYAEHCKHAEEKHELEFTCDRCPRNYETRATFQKHKLTHEKMKCKFCELVLKGKQNLEDHFGLHFKTYRCMLCAAPAGRNRKRFGKRLKLAQHLMDAHGVTKENAELVKNSLPKLIYTDPALDTRVDEVDSDYAENIEETVDIKQWHVRPVARQRYICRICKLNCGSRQLVNVHFKENHPGEEYYAPEPQQESAEELDDSADDTKVVYSCAQCGREFDTQKESEDHRRDAHPEGFALETKDEDVVPASPILGGGEQ